MLAGVVVVVLDDLAEEQRDALVGVAELDGLLEAVAALLGQRGDERAERQDGEQRDRRIRGDDGDQQADRRERAIDEGDDAELAEVQARPAAGAQPLAERRHEHVQPELGREGGEPPRPVGRVDAVDGPEHEDGRGREREPGVAEAARDALDVARAGERVDDRA